MANIDLQNRAPAVTRTPDFRNHVERRFDVLNWIPKTPVEILAEAWLPLGSVDDEYTDCYLISQNVEGQNGDFYNPCKFPPVLVRVYEQLNGTAETQIGDPGVVMDQYGNQSVIIDYWQINLGTATYQVPGVTAAPAPFTACLLKTEERTNDGTLRKIRRTYIDNGYLSDTERLLFNGALVIREITAIGFVPPTPSGWTLVTTSTEFVSGREVVRCGFANAGGGGGGGGSGGTVGDSTQYNISPNQGTTGVTVRTIKAVSNPSVVVNPIATPAGYNLISVGYDDDAGYRLWTAVYAFGQGIISSEVEQKEGGKLVIYRITGINAGTAVYAPPTPAATIGGTVTLIDTTTRNGTDASDGTVVYSWVWAEGLGEIGRDIDYSQSSDLGSTGVTKTTIRYLTAGTATFQPTSLAGSVLISKGQAQQDGYTIWTTQWAKGTGTVDTAVELENNGLLILQTIRSLGSPPGTPGGYVLIDTSVQEGDGYQIFVYKFASGLGEISRAIDYSQSSDQGATGVTRTTIRYLVAPAGTVMPTSLAGSIEVDRSVTEESGYRVWTTVWAKGAGTVDSKDDAKDNGALLLRTIRSLGTPPSTPSGYTLVNTDVQQSDGYVIYTYDFAKGVSANPVSTQIEYIQSSDQGSTGVTKTTIRYFVVPGATIQPNSLAGSVLISQEVAEQDGYRVWTTVWAKGTGTVDSQIEIKESGRLILYHVVSLGLPPATPASTIGGSVILIDSETRQADGYVIYDQRWAEGLGEISRTFNVAMTGNPLVNFNPLAPQEDDALVLCTIRYLTAGTASYITAGTAVMTLVDPTIGPAGFFRIEDSVETRDGYVLWTALWARGNGTIVDETDIREGGKLKIYHKVGLNSAPATPSSTLGGIVTQIATSVTHEANYHKYDYRWAEGHGVAEEEFIQRSDGLMEIHRTVLTAGTALYTFANAAVFDAGWSPGANGVLFRLDSAFQDGYITTRAVWMFAADGTSAPTAGTVATQAYIPFTYPGRSRIYQKSFSTGGNAYVLLDVFLSPPTTGLVLATKTVTYQTSNAVGSVSPALWNPTDYATLFSQFVNASGNSQSIVKGFEGYGAVPAGTSSFTCGGASGTLSVLGQPILTGTSGIMALSGGPASPDGVTAYTLHAEVEVEPTFVKYDGTKYYRKIVITATPAAQAALPV